MGGKTGTRQSNTKKLLLLFSLLLMIAGLGLGLHLHLSKSAIHDVPGQSSGPYSHSSGSRDLRPHSDLPQADKDAKLKQAIRMSDMEEALRLLKAGAPINTQDEEGNTLLSLAFKRKAPFRILWLLEKGADPNTIVNKCSALTRACRKEWRDVAVALLAKGARVNGNENDCATPLAAAATIHHVSYYLDFPRGCRPNVDLGSITTRTEMVRLLLDHGADPNLQPSNSGEKALPLIGASESGFKEIVELLMERGANVNMMGPCGTTALDEAARAGHREIVQLLLDRGAEVNHGVGKGSALICVAGTPHLEIAELLLDQGADVNANCCDGRTALTQTAKNGRVEMVKLLLDNGAHVGATNSEGRSALSEASIRGHKDIAVILQSYGASIPSFKTPEQRTSAMLDAAAAGNSDMVRSLLLEGMDPNTRLQEQCSKTPLMLAAKKGHTAVVKLLLDHGADPGISLGPNCSPANPLEDAFTGKYIETVKLLLANVKTIDPRRMGQRLLNNASWTGDTELVKMLLDRGMSVDHPVVYEDFEKGFGGETALVVASSEGHLETVTFLLRRGANPNKRSVKGSTALSMASRGGHSKVAEVLKAHGAK